MISIVIPVFNEQESLEKFYTELLETLEQIKEYEVLFVDDGSTDATLDLLKAIAHKNKKISIFSFRRNQGKSEALSFGFQKAKGDTIITLDADLQDKPDQIQKLIELRDKGYELVCGWRRDRKDPIHKKISSRLFNFLANAFWGLKLHDYNCGLKLYTKDAAKSIRLYGGLHRFIPLLVYQKGFRVTEIPVEHRKRQYGHSKYGFSKLWKDLPDIFTILFLSKYSEKPLHFFGVFGGSLFLIGIVILGYLTVLHFQGIGIGDRPLLFLGMLLVLSGFQVLFTGFLADIIINLSHSTNTNTTTDKDNLILRYTS